jgi:hypothetical protein
VEKLEWEKGVVGRVRQKRGKEKGKEERKDWGRGGEGEG